VIRNLPKSYDIALSYARAQDQYVKQVAYILREMNIKTFYDRDYQTELAGKYYTEEYYAIYSKYAKFAAIFLSSDYLKSDYTKVEWRAVLKKSLSEDDTFIVLRFDDAVLPGLNESIIYLSADDFDPPQFSNVLASRVKKHLRRQPEKNTDLYDDIKTFYLNVIKQMNKRFNLRLTVEIDVAETIYEVRNNSGHLCLYLQLSTDCNGCIGLTITRSVPPSKEYAQTAKFIETMLLQNDLPNIIVTNYSLDIEMPSSLSFSGRTDLHTFLEQSFNKYWSTYYV
jgi:hypothetical protein